MLLFLLIIYRMWVSFLGGSKPKEAESRREVNLCWFYVGITSDLCHLWIYLPLLNIRASISVGFGLHCPRPCHPSSGMQ